MVAVHDGCVKKGLRYNSAFSNFDSVLAGIYQLLLLLQFRDGPQSSIRGRTTWLMSDVGNGGPDVGIVHQLFVRPSATSLRLAWAA
jgi:hypothetical protein